MDALKSKYLIATAILISFCNLGCQIGYLAKSAYYQLDLLASRTANEKVLQDPNTPAEVKSKLQMVDKVMSFAESELGLSSSKNYRSYVDLKRPYVTWVVSAAQKWQLQHFEFSYPILGKMPYKGFFNEQDAKDFQAELESENLDTYLRGVSAYSTLGWFNDPVLSSMIRYKDFDFVDTLIHETVHATLYIKNNADFNERLAVFLGDKGAEAYYLKLEGPDSPTLQKVKQGRDDDAKFISFISAEILALEKWYQENKTQNEATRELRLKEIQDRFAREVLPKMSTDNYKRFVEVKLNNARMMNYKTYLKDQSTFEKVYQKFGSDFKAFISKMKELEKSDNPEAALAKLAI